MITLRFHLLPQYKYELFHIYFTWFHCTGRYELNKLTLLPMCGFIAQLVEHRTGIRGGHGFESRWSPDFFQASSFQLLKLENLLRWSHFAFIYYRSTNMNYFIYISHNILCQISNEVSLSANNWSQTMLETLSGKSATASGDNKVFSSQGDCRCLDQ